MDLRPAKPLLAPSLILTADPLTPIPEPATALLLTLALPALLRRPPKKIARPSGRAIRT